MPEKVTISHRGDRFEIGRGKRFYGIWDSGAPESDPIDRWPQTREGWEQAWMRFVSMETPGTITEAGQQRSGFRLPLPRVKFRKEESQGVRGPVWVMAAAGLLGLGVLLGVIGLFPGYFGSQSLASQAYLFVPHLLYLLTWAVSAALIVGGLRARSRWSGIRLGGLLGTGLSAVTFGLFLADLGQVIGAGASLGAGLVLSLLGWLACAAGSVLALTMAPRTANSGGLGGPSRPRATDAGPVTLLLLAAVGAVATFVPSWDSYTLSQASTGATETVTAGNAFANPGAVIAGNVAVIVAVIGVAVLAALWRPVRHGAVLLAGMVLPLAAQAISALIQASQPASPGLFGISQSQASAAGLSVSAGLTPIFWVYCVFVISLLISCAWMLTAPHYPAMPDGAPAPEPGPARPGQSTSGEAGDSDSGGEDHEESTYA